MSASQSHVESLYRERFRSLVGFARRSLPSYADAEDVVQTSFLKVLERVDLASLQAPSSYVSSVVKNEVVAELRSRSTGRRVVEKVASQPSNGGEDPSERVQEGEVRRIAVEAAEALPARQRRVLLKYLDGMTPAQIAETESTSLRKVNANQISCLISRTSKSLRRTMAREGVLSAAPIAFLKNRFRQLAMRIEPALRVLEAPGVFVVCLATAAQLSFAPGVPPAGTEPGRLPADPLSGGSDPTALEGFHSPSTVGNRSMSGKSNPDPESSETPLSLGGRSYDVEEWDERDEDHPSLVDQLLGIIDDPGNVPPPECGGPLCPE